MKIVVGSSSMAKKIYFEEYFKDYDCEFVLGKDLGIEEPVENGLTSYENALIKAHHYSRKSNLPAIALDSSLLFLDFPIDHPIQVGSHVKSPQGKELSPIEMKNYYQQLACKHGGKLRCAWIDAYALADGELEYCRDDKDISKDQSFYLCDESHEKFIASQPLDSISKNLSNVFFYDLEEPGENELLIKEGHGQKKYHLFVEKVVDEIAELLNLKRKQEGTMKELRRFKQKMDKKEIVEILDRNTHGILSVYGLEGYPYPIPLSYVQVDQTLYFHCAKSGHKIDAILKNPKVSFCVVDDDTIVPEKFTTYFKSVIVYGSALIVNDEDERRKAFDALANKYSKDVAEYLKNEEIRKAGPAALIVRIDIEHMSGKKAIEYV